MFLIPGQSAIDVERDVFNRREAVVELDEQIDLKVKLEQLLLDRRRPARSRLGQNTMIITPISLALLLRSTLAVTAAAPQTSATRTCPLLHLRLPRKKTAKTARRN